jgi:hypothetical protein
MFEKITKGNNMDTVLEKKSDEHALDIGDLGSIVPESIEENSNVESALGGAAARWFISKNNPNEKPLEEHIDIQSKLAMAIIFQTARDCASIDKKNDKIREKARAWLGEHYIFAPYTLRYCCLIINVYISGVRGYTSQQFLPRHIEDAIANDPVAFLKSFDSSRQARSEREGFSHHHGVGDIDLPAIDARSFIPEPGLEASYG